MESETRERVQSSPVFRVLRWTVPWIALFVLGYVLMNIWGGYKVAQQREQALASAEPTLPVASVGTTMSATVVTQVDQLKLRQLPDGAGEILATLAKGTKLQVHEVRNGWYRATYTASKGVLNGWVTANTLYVKVWTKPKAKKKK